MRHTTGFPHSTEKAAGNRRNSISSNQINQRGSLKISHLFIVLVEAGDGWPLNPCHPARARELIRKQRAVRICRHPYTIRLKAASPDALEIRIDDELKLPHSQQDAR